MSIDNTKKAISFVDLSGLITRIGTCGKCMRQAFLAAATAWFLFIPALIASSSFDSRVPTIAALTLGVLLTALWLTHVVVFGVRIAISTSGKTEPTDGMQITHGKSGPSRRGFFVLAAKAIAGIAFTTAFPVGVAYAYGNCHDPNAYPCSTTACVPAGADNACCPEGSQYLSHCDCKCYRSSADMDCGSYAYCH